MKNFKTIAVVAVLGLAIGGFAIAQGLHNGGHGHHRKGGAFALEHLTEGFARFAPMDVNKDGQFDATEKESVAKAMADGTLRVPGHTPPPGVVKDGTMIEHVSRMFAFLASIDANDDGVLDVAEQEKLKAAIDNGELAKLHGHR